jgi:hypothetical protein
LPLALIVERMQDAQSGVQRQSSYQSVREYRLFGANETNPSSEVLATVSFTMPTGKDYRIEKQTGSSRGEQVVRRILDHEVEESAQPPQDRASAITSKNYEFAYEAETLLDGRACYVLQLTPKRKDKNLVAGQVWIDKGSFLVRRVEGDMVKTPSWWLKSVHLKVTFDSVQGTWLQTNMEAVADARMVGPQILKARTVQLRSSDVVAASTTASAMQNVRGKAVSHRIPAELLLQPLSHR